MNALAEQKNPPPPPIAPVTPKDDELKEYVAAALSLSIIGITLYFMCRLFAVGDPQQQSTVLQLAIALAGTVTGYYFGRIPAERAATASQHAAAASGELAKQATANEKRIRDQVGDLRREVSSPVGGGAPVAAASDAPAVRKLIEERLEDILRG